MGSNNNGKCHTHSSDTGSAAVEVVNALGAVWSPDMDAYLAGEIDAGEMRCALCQHKPCQCPPFGTPEYLLLVERRHGRP